MKVIQSSRSTLGQALALAQDLGAEAIALTLGEGFSESASRVRQAGLRVHAWWQAARDLEAAAEHPSWQHMPQHHEWLRRYPEWQGGHPAVVGGWIGLNTTAAADHALRRLLDHWSSEAEMLWLGDIQGPPMGCGCGNPICRSWDNAPGEKVAPSTYSSPDLLFPLEFFRSVRQALPSVPITPVLCAECERGIEFDGLADPDGPEGTNLCQGVGCMSPCADIFWPRLLQAFRAEAVEIGLLAMVRALDKDHPSYGAPGAWAERAWRAYGQDLIPVVEPPEARRFASCLVALDAPQSCWPEAPPAGYEPTVPAIRCCQ